MTETRQERMSALLNMRFNPLHLDVQNESFMHNVPKGSETHFKVILVSQSFEGVRLVQRHQLINTLLAEEFKQGLHALSLGTYTKEEWAKRNKTPLNSPHCRGGMKKEQ